jgi:hypothetical protein
MSQAMAEAPGLFMRPHLEALGVEWDPDTGALVQKTEGAKIVGFSREGVARVSKHKDLEAQQRASERLLDRLFGKPRQALELGSQGGGMAIVQIPRTPERARAVAKVLIESGAVDADLAQLDGEDS